MQETKRKSSHRSDTRDTTQEVPGSYYQQQHTPKIPAMASLPSVGASAGAGLTSASAIPSGVPMPSTSEPLQAPAPPPPAPSSVGATNGDTRSDVHDDIARLDDNQVVLNEKPAEQTSTTTNTAAAPSSATSVVNEKVTNDDAITAKATLAADKSSKGGKRGGWAAFGGGKSNKLEKKNKTGGVAAGRVRSASSSGEDSSSSSLVDEKQQQQQSGDGKVIDAKSTGAKEKDEHPPVGLFTMFRYATPFEMMLNVIGLVLAAGAGATQVSAASERDAELDSKSEGGAKKTARASSASRKKKATGFHSRKQRYEARGLDRSPVIACLWIVSFLLFRGNLTLKSSAFLDHGRRDTQYMQAVLPRFGRWRRETRSHQFLSSWVLIVETDEDSRRRRSRAFRCCLEEKRELASIDRRSEKGQSTWLACTLTSIPFGTFCAMADTLHLDLLLFRQPLMTLIFGRLTTSFTGFGSIILQIQANPNNPALLAQLAQAREQLKHDSSLNALYLVIIGESPSTSPPHRNGR